MAVCVDTARLSFINEGSAYSADFSDIYHSEAGALEQARHVFVEGNGLPGRWQGRENFVVLETGFGVGLNFLATWAAMRADPGRPRRLHFVSAEKLPPTRDDLRRALERHPELASLAGALVERWPPPIAGFHRLHFDAGQVILTLMLGDAREALRQLDARVDAFYLDGFAPARNPEIWSPETVREIARLAAPGATFATWTVAGGVRNALADAGFVIERRPGFGHKREMLLGRWPGRAPAPDGARREALVIGGGLSGTLCAERLASRGWRATVIDARETGPGNAVGVVRPIANLRDATNARVSRPAFLYALQHFATLQIEGYHLQWQRCGALQLAGDDDEAQRFEAIARSHGYPPEFLHFVERARASEIAGRDVARSAWYFPGGAWVSLPSLAIASLARAGESVTRRSGVRVERLACEAGMWRAFDSRGATIAQAPVAILANAADAMRLAPDARLRLSSVRGQVTYLPPGVERALARPVGGKGYVAPLPDGGFCLGASYQHDDADESLRAADHRDNLAKAEAMLPGFTSGIHPMGLSGWTGHRATVADRLPIFGACEAEGLLAATGLGSRGLLWAPLGAELIASVLAGEPGPLPRDLAGAISPRRFLS